MGASNKHYGFDCFRLDPTEHILLRDGQIVPLTPKVFETLLVLVEKNGHVVNKDELLRQVWSDTFVEETNLTKNISILRKVLGENDLCKAYIETIPKRGYRFIGAVQEIAKRVESIAVLPLENLSGDVAQEYFADGMTDSLITELAKVKNLRVISRHSTVQFKGTRKKITEIAVELNVDAVIIGTVFRSGDKVRISVQLFRAEAEQSLWAEAYERNFRDVLTLQKEVAQGIAGSIKVELAAPEPANLSRQNFTNPEAQDDYLKGLFYWHQGAITTGSFEEIKALHFKSCDYFRQAINLEPYTAKAHTGLAQTYYWLGSYGLAEYFPKSKEAALTAIRLDETNSQAHTILSGVLWRDEWKFAEAEREMKRAIELNPNDNRYVYAQFLSSLGRHEEALEAANVGERLDPLNIDYKQYNGWIYIGAGRYDAAEKRFRELIDLDPTDYFSRRGLYTTLAYQRRYQEAIAEHRRMVNETIADPANALGLAWLYARAGQRSEAMKILNKVKKLPKAETNGFWRHSIAGTYAVLGDKERAFVWLEKGYSKRAQPLMYLKVEASFDSLRDDPRFQDLLRRIGFPE